MYYSCIEHLLASDTVKQPFFVVIGHPIQHSLSPIMHNEALRFHKLKSSYVAVDVPEKDLPKLPVLLRHPLFQGANITIPYKRTIMGYVDQCTALVQQLQAANTIIRSSSNTLIADNTDVFGFLEPLKPFVDHFHQKEAVVFGTGGSSSAILQALKTLPFSHIFQVSRSELTARDLEENMLTYELWPRKVTQPALFVNCTPMGMKGSFQHQTPMQEHQVKALKHAIFYDLVYNPQETLWLSFAKKYGATYLNGLPMLVHQGHLSFQHWTGKPFPIQKIMDLLQKKMKS